MAERKEWEIDNEKWAPIVGHFMLAFGSIESSVNFIIQHWCSLRTLLFVRSTLTLEARIKFVRELAEERDFGAGNREILVANLGDVKGLAKTRNLIAHSPLTLTLFHAAPPDERGLKPLIESILSARDNEKHITFDDLQTATKRAKRMAEVMMQNQIEISWHGKALLRLSDQDNMPHVAKLDRA